MNIELVKEVNLAEVLEKIDNNQTLAIACFAFLLIAYMVIAFIVYALLNADKEFKSLREKCDILSKRMDNLVDMVNHHDE